MSSSPALRPADMLVGLTTPDGWLVESMIAPSPAATGGHFSSSYIAVRDGCRAFLKALDYVAALGAPDPARALEGLTAAFNFERDLLRSCDAGRMPNVVRTYSDGDVAVPAAGPMGRVSYLVFELADGDIRRFRALAGHITVAWALRSVHQATMGLRQLHSAGIAHQDLKPSNLLTFSKGVVGKLGDLGRASQLANPGPHDDLVVAGDATYAPPEAYYGFQPTDFGTRRKACDLFHLGSLLLFQFTGVNATGAIFAELDSAYWPATSGGSWDGTYDDVLVYVRDAVSRVAEQLPSLGDAVLETKVRACFRELCEPDPRRRGHPKDHARRHGDPYSLERYVSHFHAMASRAERLAVKILVP